MRARKKNEQLNIRLTADTFSRLSKLSARERRTNTDIVRLLLEAALARLDSASLDELLGEIASKKAA